MVGQIYLTVNEATIIKTMMESLTPIQRNEIVSKTLEQGINYDSYFDLIRKVGYKTRRKSNDKR